MNALIVVDVQNDFLPGGALAVAQGDEIIPVINGLLDRFDLVVATQDWHPPGHQSFASSHAGKSAGDVIDLQGTEQVLWPDHCLQNTPGAEFAGALNTSRFAHVVRKGTDSEIDSYSGFFDNGHRRATGLQEYLRAQAVHHCFVVGLATDYCVKFTALDGVQCGFTVTVIRDACRAVNLHAHDERQAIEEMQRAGVGVIESGDLASDDRPSIDHQVQHGE